MVSTGQSASSAAVEPDAHVPTGVDVQALVDIITEAVERQLGEHLRQVNGRVAESERVLAAAHTDLRIDLMTRLDERATELVRGQETHAAAVNQRLTQLDRRVDGVPAELDERLDRASDAIAAQSTATEARLDAQIQAIAQRVEGQLTAVFDGVRLQTAAMEAEAGELRRRVDELQARIADTDSRIDEVAEAAARVDHDAIEALQQEMSRAVGEATLVRIELDRLAATSSERFDKVTVRMGEIEALLADDTDVTAAVQLERIEELERALAELDPDQFVRRDDANGRASDSTTTQIGAESPLDAA